MCCRASDFSEKMDNVLPPQLCANLASSRPAIRIMLAKPLISLLSGDMAELNLFMLFIYIFQVRGKKAGKLFSNSPAPRQELRHTRPGDGGRCSMAAALCVARTMAPREPPREPASAASPLLETCLWYEIAGLHRNPPVP